MTYHASKKVFSYGKQTIDDDDIRAVVDVLKSDWLTQGPYVTKFEQALANKLGPCYASAVCNGTAALHLAGLALDWKPGDIVLTSPLTFLASTNCILYAGATPDFVDIHPSTYTMDVDRLEEKIREYRAKNKRIKAVIAVDYAGHPCDWESLRRLADTYAFQLVNDHCHALGAKYKGAIAYAVKYADAVILSFHPVKHITTGEGGAVLTNHKVLSDKIKILRTHGIIKDDHLEKKDEGPWYYEMQMLGFNYRITDFQCALGLNQLRKLDEFIKRRQEIALFYNNIFIRDERFIIPKVAEQVEHSYHLYPLQIRFEKISINRKELFQRLREKNIICQVHYIPIHLQPYYRKHYDFREGDFPVAEEFYRREVSIPMYPSLKKQDLDYISSVLFELVLH